jgi:hypothetical protein
VKKAQSQLRTIIKEQEKVEVRKQGNEITRSIADEEKRALDYGSK